MGSKRRVPFLDLRLQQEALQGEIEASISRTINSADFILGKQLSEFESEFAAYCDCEFGIGVSSGTEAIHLALRALDIGHGDEVITVSNTFVATVEAILYTGATPVFTDVDPQTFCIDPKSLEAKITSKTRAVIPVHLYGQPCDMAAIMSIARRHNLVVVEDAAQAHGATIDGKKIGSFGDAAAYSFYPTKNLGGIGDGGAITTNNPDLDRRLRALRHHAQYEPNVFPELGFNSRLDSIQAGVLSAKLKYLDNWNHRRREIAKRYRSKISSPEYQFQTPVPGSDPVFHILAVSHPRREAVHTALTDADIGFGRHIAAPIHRQPGYAKYFPDGESLPVVERLCEDLISLPVFPEMTDDQVDYVAEILGQVEVSV